MKASRSEVIKFTVVMIAFIIGMIFLLLYKVRTWWIWAIYITVWTVVEGRIAINMHLKWWHWVLIIGGLSVIDLIIIYLVH